MASKDEARNDIRRVCDALEARARAEGNDPFLMAVQCLRAVHDVYPEAAVGSQEIVTKSGARVRVHNLISDTLNGYTKMPRRSLFGR